MAAADTTPRPVLQDGAVYWADNGRRICARCAGATALYTGHDLSGQKVERVTAADVRDWPEDLGAAPLRGWGARRSRRSRARTGGPSRPCRTASTACPRAAGEIDRHDDGGAGPWALPGLRREQRPHLGRHLAAPAGRRDETEPRPAPPAGPAASPSSSGASGSSDRRYAGGSPRGWSRARSGGPRLPRAGKGVPGEDRREDPLGGRPTPGGTARSRTSASRPTSPASASSSWGASTWTATRSSTTPRTRPSRTRRTGCSSGGWPGRSGWTGGCPRARSSG